VTRKEKLTDDSQKTKLDLSFLVLSEIVFDTKHQLALWKLPRCLWTALRAWRNSHQWKMSMVSGSKRKASMRAVYRRLVSIAPHSLVNANTVEVKIRRESWPGQMDSFANGS